MDKNKNEKSVLIMSIRILFVISLILFLYTTLSAHSDGVKNTIRLIIFILIGVYAIVCDSINKKNVLNILNVKVLGIILIIIAFIDYISLFYR